MVQLPMLNAIGLTRYDRSDISVRTDFRVRDRRSISPRGALIHSTGGTDSKAWLAGRSADQGVPASCNCLIDRSGHQWFITTGEWYPYHAGKSRLQLDRVYRNDEVSQVLIGIELEYTNEQTPNYFQYDSLADIIIWYSTLYQWRWPYVILGHGSVALPLGRRSDPVGFDWGSFMGRLYVRSMAARIPGLVIGV